MIMGQFIIYSILLIAFGVLALNIPLEEGNKK